MKNLFFTLSVAIVLTSAFSSCKKDRTCTCTDEDGEVTTIQYKKVTKQNADCVTYTDIDSNGDMHTTTCNLD